MISVSSRVPILLGGLSVIGYSIFGLSVADAAYKVSVIKCT